MTSATLAPRARREFAGAAEWVARDNPHAAQSFRDAVARAAELIEGRPQIGSIRRHLLYEPFRFWSVAGKCIVFRMSRASFVTQYDVLDSFQLCAVKAVPTVGQSETNSSEVFNNYNINSDICQTIGYKSTT